MILQWFNNRKINKLEVQIETLKAQLDYLQTLKGRNGSVDYNIALRINYAIGELTGAQTRLKQLKND